MIMQINLSRRNALKLGAAALVSIPVVSIAAQNSGLRASMKYIDKTDKPDQRCEQAYICLSENITAKIPLGLQNFLDTIKRIK